VLFIIGQVPSALALLWAPPGRRSLFPPRAGGADVGPVDKIFKRPHYERSRISSRETPPGWLHPESHLIRLSAQSESRNLRHRGPRAAVDSPP